MSSLEDYDADIGAVDPPARPLQAASHNDLGTREPSDCQSLKQLIEANVGQADSFVSSIRAARGNAEASVAELEKNYIGLAAELEAKVEQQQRDQLQRLKADHVQLKGWLSQYLADLKAAKE